MAAVQRRGVFKEHCGTEEGRVQGMLPYRGGACAKMAAVQKRSACRLSLHVLGEGRRTRCLRRPSDIPSLRGYTILSQDIHTKTKILMREKGVYGGNV